MVQGIDKLGINKTIDIIMYLKGKKRVLCILECKHLLKSTTVFILGKYDKRVLPITKNIEQGSQRDKNVHPRFNSMIKYKDSFTMPR